MNDLERKFHRRGPTDAAECVNELKLPSLPVMEADSGLAGSAAHLRDATPSQAMSNPHRTLVKLMVGPQTEFSTYLGQIGKGNPNLDQDVDPDRIADAFTRGPTALGQAEVELLLTADLNGLTLLRAYLDHADAKIPEPWLDAMDDVFGVPKMRSPLP